MGIKAYIRRHQNMTLFQSYFGQVILFYVCLNNPFISIAAGTIVTVLGGGGGSVCVCVCGGGG